MAYREQHGPELREDVPAASTAFPTMDELRVEPERDVVQKQPLAHAPDVDPPLLAREGRERRDGIVAVEAEVAREVVASPVRDDDEGKTTLDGDLRDSGE
jgi:hypothetical protein